MTEDTRARASTDPTAVLKQWQEAWKTYSDMSTNVWLKASDAHNVASASPNDQYRAWLQSITAAQEQFRSIFPGILNPAEAWQKWLDTTTDVWKKAAESGADTLGLATQWWQMMEQMRAKLLSGETIPSDPFTFFKQWYETTSETLAKNVGDVIGSDTFMQANSRFLESYLRAVREFGRASEEYFHSLQLPTRSDIARVAQLVVSLDEKIDVLDDTFEHLEDKLAQMAKSAAVENVARYVASLEGKISGIEDSLVDLQRQHAQTSKSEAVEQVAQLVNALAGKVAQVESTLIGFENQIAQAARSEATANLDQRLGRVESKLDMLLASIDKLQADQHAASSAADASASVGVNPPVAHKVGAAGTNAARRKSQKPTE